MADIRNENYVQRKTQRLFEMLNKQNNDVIKTICQRINDLNAKDTNLLKSVLEYSISDLPKIRKIIADTTKKSISEVTKIFEQAALDNINFAQTFYKYRNMKQGPVTKSAIEGLLQAVSEKTNHEFLNITNSTVMGFIDSSGNFKNIRSTYFSVIDNAIISTATGKEDYYSAVQTAIKSMADSGLRARFEGTNKNGKPYVYTRRLDSQIMMNVQDAIRQLSTQIQIKTAAEYGADGVEISVHGLCAPDHLPIQGKQYTNEEYEKLQVSLKRPISTMNCRHFAFPIIIGVNKPVYSQNDLKDIAKESNRQVKYTDLHGETKEMTRYEATQRQRQFELEIRKAEERKKAYKAAGDKLNEVREKKYVSYLKSEYTKFSRQIDLQMCLKKTNIIS